MQRRTFLALGGVGLGATSVYAGWTVFSSPTIPDGMEVETLYVEGDVSAEHFSRDHGHMDSGEEYATIIETEETADREMSGDESVTEFIADTDFSASYLVVVQNAMQSMPDLELDSIHRRDEGLRIDVSIDAPWSGVDDDLITHSLLIRITDDESGAPDTVDVNIDGYDSIP